MCENFIVNFVQFTCDGPQQGLGQSVTFWVHFRSDEKLWLEGSNLLFLLQILTEYTSTCGQGRFNNKKLTLAPILEYHASELGFLTLPPMSQKIGKTASKFRKITIWSSYDPLKLRDCPQTLRTWTTHELHRLRTFQRHPISVYYIFSRFWALPLAISRPSWPHSSWA